MQQKSEIQTQSQKSSQRWLSTVLTITLALLGAASIHMVFADAPTPLAIDGSITALENTPAVGVMMSQGATSTFPLAYLLVTNPVNGSLSNVDTSTGAFTYTPNINFMGSDSFTFLVNNGGGNSNTATESITITGTSIVTSTIDTSNTSNLEALIAQIQSEINTLRQRIETLLEQAGITTPLPPNTGGMTTSSGPWFPSGSPSLDTPPQNIRAGTSIDLGGRNFGQDEPVQVKSNEGVIATAHADDGGNFTTGSLPIPSNASGTETYTLTGMQSGIQLSETVTIVQ